MRSKSSFLATTLAVATTMAISTAVDGHPGHPGFQQVPINTFVLTSGTSTKYLWSSTFGPGYSLTLNPSSGTPFPVAGVNLPALHQGLIDLPDFAGVEFTGDIPAGTSMAALVQAPTGFFSGSLFTSNHFHHNFANNFSPPLPAGSSVRAVNIALVNNAFPGVDSSYRATVFEPIVYSTHYPHGSILDDHNWQFNHVGPPDSAQNTTNPLNN
jgi:hypothetical protein